MDFLTQWLKKGRFPAKANKITEFTDNEIMAGILKASRSDKAKGHSPARRIANREHFKLLYERNPEDIKMNRDATKIIYEKATEKFGNDNVRLDIIPAKRKGYDFPVLTNDDRIISSTKVSETLSRIPPAGVGYIFIEPKQIKEAIKWLENNRKTILSIPEEENES